MKVIEENFGKIMRSYPVGSKIIFKDFELDKFDLNGVFHIDAGEYVIKKQGVLNIGKQNILNLYLENNLIFQVCFVEENMEVNYFIFKNFDKYYLKNSFDRSFWLGGRDERGFLFYDDYFYVREINKIFEEFIKNICINNFKEFDDFDSIEFEVEDAFFRTNLLKVLEESKISKESLEVVLAKEIKDREWLIDYVFDEDSLEIYYHFSEEDIEKRFDFMKNVSYTLKLCETETVYGKKVISSLFQRDIKNKFYDKEYIELLYDSDLSVILLKSGIILDKKYFQKGE